MKAPNQTFVSMDTLVLAAAGIWIVSVLINLFS